MLGKFMLLLCVLTISIRSIDGQSSSSSSTQPPRSSTSRRPSTPSAPNWFGSFNIDSQCNRRACCCLSGKLDITRYQGQMRVRAGLADTGCDGQTFISSVMPIPYIYSIKINLLGGDAMCYLSSDSSKITVKTDDVRCDGNAFRNMARSTTDVSIIIICVIATLTGLKNMI